MLADNFSFMQAQVEDLDNRNSWNNIWIRGIPESVIDLTPAISKFFCNLLPDKPLSAFTCDRIYRALCPKPTPDKPPRDVVVCMKDFLIKEDIMRAFRNTPNIELEGNRIQIYPDISPATLDRRCRMKEVISIPQTARIKYRWGFPFKLSLMHNSSTYTVYNLIEGKVKLSWACWSQNLQIDLPSLTRSSTILSTPSSQPQPESPKKMASILSRSSSVIFLVLFYISQMFFLVFGFVLN